MAKLLLRMFDVKRGKVMFGGEDENGLNNGGFEHDRMRQSSEYIIVPCIM